MTQSAMAALTGYCWPGNVRELLHVLEQAAETADEGLITPLQLGLAGPVLPAAATDERLQIEAALRACGGNTSAAARYLGVSRTTLYRRLERHGLR